MANFADTRQPGVADYPHVDRVGGIAAFAVVAFVVALIAALAIAVLRNAPSFAESNSDVGIMYGP